MKLLRKKIVLRSIALFMLINFVGQLLYPTAAYALTGGPSQPEVTQFAPVSASDMVDIFTGDFSYNIPLFELPGPNGGYPFNLSYQSAPGMDQEASWVGLGWNINPGSIVRNLRGLPDDFDGQMIEKEMDMKPNLTMGVSVTRNWEIFGGDLQKKKEIGSFSLSQKVYFNSYKGLGLTTSPGLNFQMQGSGGRTTAGLGFNISMDSQDGGIGANINLNLSLSRSNGKQNSDGSTTMKSFGMGLGFNTNSGINASMNFSRTKRTTSVKGATETSAGASGAGVKTINDRSGADASASMSFAMSSSTPNIGLQMTGASFTGSLTLGFAGKPAGTYDYKWGFAGFVDVSSIANTNEDLPAYGYLNYHNKTSEEALTDFNREKDGIIRNTTPNLPAPVLTYDYFNVFGQGTGGMFRAYRPEVGYVHEQKRVSSSGGGTLGFNLPMEEPKKLGINGAINYSESTSGKWDANQNYVSGNGSSSADEFAYFRSKQDDNGRLSNEGVYFKMHGNMSAMPTKELDHIMGEDAVRFKFVGNELKRQLVNEKKNIKGAMTSDLTSTRRLRSQLITPVYNKDILRQAGTSSLYEMDVRFYNDQAFGSEYEDFDDMDPSKVSSVYDRRDDAGNESHIGGFIVTNADGSRYIYGLPAYNNTTEDHIYTSKPDAYGTCITHKDLVSGTPVDYHLPGTDEFKSVTRTPSYPHSHLLTSVLGTDYIDIDNVAGPSDGDYGYWVKFNYIRAHEGFKWRTPYTGASYDAGSNGTYEDDKISFSYGEKEIWYVATVETKTHIAVFEISERQDGLSADELFAASTDKGTQNLYKLDKIKLYVKEEYKNQANPVPIQTIHFEYDYSLCKNIPNNSGNQDFNKDVLGNNITTGQANGDGNINAGDNGKYGKLTLKAVYFTYKNDHTGKNNKYTFTYGNNPDYEYQTNRYDRWGTYSWYSDNSECDNIRFPYTSQFYQHPYPTDPNKPLPSGFGSYSTYTDSLNRYFHRKTDVAASAWCLTKIGLPSGGSINVEYESDDYAYVQHRQATQMFKITSLGLGDDPTDPYENQNDWIYEWSSAPESCERRRRVYFALEEPIAATISDCDVKQKVFDDYVAPMLQPDGRYQVYINARVKLRGNLWEDIGAYYNLDINPGCTSTCAE